MDASWIQNHDVLNTSYMKYCCLFRIPTPPGMYKTPTGYISGFRSNHQHRIMNVAFDGSAIGSLTGLRSKTVQLRDSLGCSGRFRREIPGQIIATSHDLGPQMVVEYGKSPYFREI